MSERHEIICGTERIPVEVSFDRHRSLRLCVRPEGTVCVRAPFRTSTQHIHAHVQRKAAWILRHLERFRALRQAARPLAYVSGETLAFLGRDYTLEVRQGERNAVRLSEECVEVTTRLAPRPDQVRRLLDAWHLEQAKELFSRLIREALPSLDAHGVPRPAQLKIRAMTSRWGTCSLARTITLNRHLVRAPLSCVEYVVAHELCHLRHHSHNAQFYGLLEAVMPDWKARRKRLRQVAI